MAGLSQVEAVFVKLEVVVFASYQSLSIFNLGIYLLHGTFLSGVLFGYLLQHKDDLLWTRTSKCKCILMKITLS